jgi:hypothetical protein
MIFGSRNVHFQLRRHMPRFSRRGELVIRLGQDGEKLSCAARFRRGSVGLAWSLSHSFLIVAVFSAQRGRGTHFCGAKRGANRGNQQGGEGKNGDERGGTGMQSRLNAFDHRLF